MFEYCSHVFLCASVVAATVQVTADVVSWDGGGDGTSWHDEFNWSADALPGHGDDAVIDVAGDIVVVHSTGDHAINSLDCAETLSLTSGSLDIAAASTVLTYEQSGGTLQGSGDLTITGLATWTGGTITGTGTMYTDGGLDLSGISSKYLSRDLDNGDVATWSGAGQLRVTDPAVFTNLPGATFEAQNDQLLWWQTAPGTFDNQGTFRKTSSVGTTDVRIPFQNSGTVEVQTGTMLVRTDFTSTGDVSGAGSFIFNTGTHLLDGASSFTVDDVLVQSGTTSVLGTLAPANLTLAAGTLDLTSDVLIPAYEQSGGTLQGSGDLTVTGPATWTGGVITGTGAMYVDAGLDLSGGTVFLSRDLVNSDLVTWSGAGQLRVSDPAVFTNLPGAVFEVQNDVLLWWQSAPGSFDNQGTFRKTSSTGTTDIRIPFQNSGSVEVQTGTLLVREDFTSTGAVSGAGAFTFNTGTHLLDGASSLTVADVLVENGTTNVLGAFAPTNLTVASGTLDLTSDVLIPAYEQSGGTLQGSGDLTLTGPATWTSGTITGTGTMYVDGGLSLSGSTVFLSRDLVNSDLVTWSGAGQLRVSDPAVFTNLPGAVFEVQNDVLLWWQSAPGSFDNQGTFRKTSSTGTTDIRVPFQNSGTVEAQTGTLLVRSNDYVQTGGVTVVESILEMVSAIVDLQGGVLSGDGLVIGDVMNAGIVAPGSSVGELTIQGDYTQTSAGTLSIELGGIGAGQYDVLTIDGNAFLAGFLTIPLTNGFFPETGQQFTILTTTGTRQEEFDLVDCPGIYQVVYLPVAVRLDVLESQVPGDINCDGTVDITDLLLLLGAWGPCSDCPEDLDGNGEVGVDDLLLVLSYWTT